VPRKRQKVGAEGADIAWNSAGGLDRVDVQEAARFVRQASRLRNRLKGSGLVAGEHEGNQRPGSLPGERRETARERRQIDHAGWRRRHPLDRRGRKPAAGQHRRVLDGGDQQAAARGGAWSGAGQGRERQHVGLGSARGEHHVARLGGDQRRHRAARVLAEAARGPALGMDRRRVAGSLERRDHDGARLVPQRRGRVPVEIDPGHGFWSGFRSHSGNHLHNTRPGTQHPSKHLLFVPDLVLKAPAAQPRRSLLAAQLAKI
jgi:hypothetical protein